MSELQDRQDDRAIARLGDETRRLEPPTSNLEPGTYMLKCDVTKPPPYQHCSFLEFYWPQGARFCVDTVGPEQQLAFWGPVPQCDSSVAHALDDPDYRDLLRALERLEERPSGYLLRRENRDIAPFILDRLVESGVVTWTLLRTLEAEVLAAAVYVHTPIISPHRWRDGRDDGQDGDVFAPMLDEEAWFDLFDPPEARLGR